MRDLLGMTLGGRSCDMGDRMFGSPGESIAINSILHDYYEAVMRITDILRYNLLTHSRTNEYLSRIGFVTLLSAIIWYPDWRTAGLQQILLYAVSIGIGVLLTLRGYHSTSRYRCVVTTFYLVTGCFFHLLIPEIN